MRLVFFDFTINFGGGPQGSVYLAQRLNHTNEVHVIDVYGCCRDYCRAVEQAGIPFAILYPKQENSYIGYAGKPFKRFCRILSQLPEFFQIRRRLQKTLLEINPDAIWVNNHKSLVFITSNPKLKKFPVIVYFRGWGTPDQISPSFLRLLKGRVSAIIGHARATIEKLSELGIPPEKLHYTPNTVDFEDVLEQAAAPVCPPVPDMRRFPKILLPAARLVREKGLLTAVSAVAQLIEKGYDPALWLPGKVATGVDASFLEMLKNTIQQQNLEDNIHFLGWRTDMEALVNACDIVILPSYTEGFPRIILESMLLKKPVIATPVGGIPEAVVNEQTGLIMEIDNDQMLADCIVRYIGDPVFRERIVRQAHDFVYQHHHPDKNTKKVLEVFESVSRKESPVS